MATDGSVSEWLVDLREGDELAAERLWERYFGRLVRVASRRLPTGIRRDFDEEDVAVSAFRSFCEGARGGRLPRLSDRENLWALLVVITSRKAARRLRDRRTLKRGEGKVHGESILQHEPTPEFAEALIAQSTELFDFLGDDSLRRIARLKMEGWSNEEIARQMECALRTIERRLGLIRRLWLEHDASG